MDKFEKRRQALQQLVDDLGRGGITSIAKRIGKEPSYVSRMLYPPSKSGAKRIGEDSAELLRKAYPDFFVGARAIYPSTESIQEADKIIPYVVPIVVAYEQADPYTKAVVDAILGVGVRPTWFDSSASGFIDLLKNSAKNDKNKNKEFARTGTY